MNSTETTTTKTPITSTAAAAKRNVYTLDGELQMKT